MAFMGMRGTGDWVTDQRPLNWREGILYLYPNGMTPLTAILSKMGSQKVDDPQFHWWTEAIGSVGGTCSAAYTTPDLLTPYVSGGVAGTVLYFTTSLALAQQLRPGHQVLLRDASDLSVDVNAKVTAVLENGASSVFTVKLLEADDNSTLAHDLSDCDNFLVIGNVNAEGSESPQALALNPTKIYNYTQIWKTSLDITRTARATKLRTGDEYKKMKREALEMHSIEQELSFLWGVPTELTGTNGKPERTTGGLRWFINTYGTGGINYDFRTHATWHTSTWAAGGEAWLDTMLEVIFRYGANEKLAFCGSGALLGIQQLAKAGGQINLTPTSTSYGIKILSWITPFGVINLKTHPLFSYDATTRNMILIFEPAELKFRYILDTKFEDVTLPGIDGTKEQFITEAGLEFGFPQKCAILNGVGLAHDA